jgi:hypothetical protein
MISALSAGDSIPLVENECASSAELLGGVEQNGKTVGF